MPHGFEQGPRRSPEEVETIESLRAKVEVLEEELARERRAKEEALNQLDEAGLDLLTRLPLRRRFETVAAALFARTPAEGEKTRAGLPERIALIIADVDHFKKVNDTYGHEKGDEVLHSVAEALAGGVRPTDLSCRWGGEEMVVLLPGASEEDAAMRAEELRKRLEELSYEGNGGKQFHATASLGVASVENDGSATLTELAKRADEALYQAKKDGRNRVLTASELAERRANEPEQGEFRFDQAA